MTKIINNLINTTFFDGLREESTKIISAASLEGQILKSTCRIINHYLITDMEEFIRALESACNQRHLNNLEKDFNKKRIVMS